MFGDINQIRTVREAIHEIYASYVRAKEHVIGRRDREVRHPEWTRLLLDEFGRPDGQAYNVCVTGSKGKGSHSIFMACMLEQMGFRVGLFTSPHLVDFMERFRVNGQVMPEPAFVSWSRQALEIVSRFEIPTDQYCGPVGILAAVGASWFATSNTKVNVFECGRGALHDDVNQVRHQGALITPVFLEHARQLGPTLQDIGREKSGVVTSDTQWVVSHAQHPAVREVIESRTSMVSATLVEPSPASRVIVEEYDSFAAVSVRDGSQPTVRLLIPVDYVPFVANATASLLAATQVATALRGGDSLPDELDLRNLVLPGRLHIVRRHPLTVVDGTIHARSADIVVDWVQRHRSRKGRIGAILGLPADKDGVGVLERIGTVLDWCILSKAHNPHLNFGDEWYSVAVAKGMNVTTAEDIEEAAKLADNRLDSDDMLLVLGTQSFVGDSLVHYGADSRSIWMSERQ